MKPKCKRKRSLEAMRRKEEYVARKEPKIGTHHRKNNYRKSGRVKRSHRKARP